jgi:hypothetical protein
MASLDKRASDRRARLGQGSRLSYEPLWRSLVDPGTPVVVVTDDIRGGLR